MEEPNPGSERPAWLDDPNIVVFAGESELPVGAVERHGLGEWLGDHFGRRKEEVRDDWQKLVGQINYLLDGVSAVTENYELQEITFELGFSAEGQIVFVAKAG